ncbi:hypothetical protein LPJ64_001089 [Coemansia asiatica]|uniref:MSP domain-containing protein n=1 Tax=Coemansia asiatica TaxID=1052880 RepID=A0A9W7XPQ3_9FUNG|nr:hypothetical protein LPJ64_001089 [Coemansia asiatica]
MNTGFSKLPLKQPENYEIYTESEQGQFSVRGLSLQTVIDEIYQNGLHTVVPFWVVNNRNGRLELDLQIDSMTFKVQQHNANWEAVTWQQRISFVKVVSKEKDHSATLVCSAETQREFNEAFNQIEGTRHIELEAGQTAELSLLLLPPQDASQSPNINSMDLLNAEERLRTDYCFSECFGKVSFLRAGSNDSLTCNVRGRFCRSVLEMEPATSRVYLDDCVVGRAYERTLRVHNASAIALDWTMAVVETTDSTALGTTLRVQAADSESGAMGGRLEHGARRQIVVRYTPQAVGEFLCRFAVENANDAGNTRHWVFRARASQRAKPRRVELLSVGDIDFGECTSGMWYRSDVALKNIGDATVAVRFRVEGNLVGLAVRVRDETGAALTGAEDEVGNDAGDDAAGGEGEALESASLGSETINTTTQASGTADITGAGSSTVGDGSRRAHSHTRAHQAVLLDEVLVKPGAVRTVSLAVMGSSATPSGQFLRQSFTLFCECATPASGPAAKSTAAAPAFVERLTVPCTLNMCTPIVRVTPALLDFGTVDVGTLKTMYLTIENLSPVPATVVCVLESKVINCTRAPIVVPPRSAEAVRVDIYPRRINARYRKQIIVRNVHSRGNDSVVDVRSVHVDQRRMAYHNVFYKTLVAGCEQNFVDFGAVPLHARAVRRIALANLCTRALTLELAPSDAGSIAAYTAVPRPSSSSSSSLSAAAATLSAEAREVARRLPRLERQAVMHSNIELFKEHQPVSTKAASAAVAAAFAFQAPSSKSVYPLQRDVFVDKTVEQGHVCLVPFVRRGPAPMSVDYLNLATACGLKASVRLAKVRICEGADSDAANEPPKALTSKLLADSETHAHVAEGEMSETAAVAAISHAWDILDEIIEHMDMVPQTLFASTRAEDDYVRRQVDLRNYVDLLVDAGFLRPITRIRVPASAETPVVVMLSPVESPATRFDANLYFKLIDRPADLLPFTTSTGASTIGTLGNSYQLPVRRFLIQASLRRAELDIGQKSINVGNMQIDESCRKYLVIQNRSDAPLMYAIRKTGSIASGDIRFVDNNRYGVVRAFDSRKIVFVFCPALHGVYNEQISIANVLDPSGGKTATLKAVVRRPSKFYIQALLLDFSDNGDDDSASSVLTLGSRSQEFRLLVVKNMTPKTRVLSVRAADPQPAEPVTLSAVFPPDVAVSQDADRLLDRETMEKIEALEQKIKIAMRKNHPEKIDKYRAKIAKLRDAKTPADDIADTAAIERLAGDTELVVTLAPNGEARIPVFVVPTLVSAVTDSVVAASGQFVVHEIKDKDNVKTVTVTARVRT